MPRYYRNMSSFEFETPFRNLGQELKGIREKLCESLAEVSGAVEIDTKVLKQIENGFERPSEELLMLLVSHFGIKDDDAVGLWELAGYNQPIGSTQAAEDLKARPILMMMALDTRILYTDSAHVSADQSGVVLNFMQNNGPSSQKPTTVARIGMSYTQAKKVSQVLNHTLTQAEALRKPKALPAPRHRQSSGKKPKSN